MREPEREVTYALNHNRRLKLCDQGGFFPKVESLFQLLCFEWTCGYGLNPGRPLKIMGLGHIRFRPPLYAGPEEPEAGNRPLGVAAAGPGA